MCEDSERDIDDFSASRGAERRKQVGVVVTFLNLTLVKTYISTTVTVAGDSYFIERIIRRHKKTHSFFSRRRRISSFRSCISNAS